MKYRWIFLLCLWSLSNFAEARKKSFNPPFQEDFLGMSFPNPGSKWPFSKGAVWLNISSSIGLIGYPSFGNRRAYLPLMISGDYSISDHIAVGPYLGFFRLRYDDSFNGTKYESRLTTYHIGARAILHATDILNAEMGAGIDARKWDLYGGLSAGFVSRVWTIDNEFKNARNDYSVSLYPSIGLIIGARYLVTDNFGIMAEVGKGSFGLISFGVSGKLN